MRERIQTTCLVILATVAVGAALRWLSPVMIPFVLAVFIALSLGPLVDMQVQRARIPRPLAMLSTLALALVLLVLVAALVSASVRELAQNADAYAAQLGSLVDRVLTTLPDGTGEAIARDLRGLLDFPVKTVGSMLMSTTNAILDLLSKSLLVFLFVTFLLLGSGRGAPSTGVWRETTVQVQRFVATKAVISAVTGLLVGLVLWLLGIDLALVFGLFAFLLNFIPSIGSIVATLLPLPVVLVSPDVSSGVAVLAIALPGAIQITIGNFVDPRIMGERFALHPVTVLLALMVWGMIWGIVGMLLATPITAVMRMLLERTERGRGLAELMSGQLPGSAGASGG